MSPRRDAAGRPPAQLDSRPGNAPASADKSPSRLLSPSKVAPADYMLPGAALEVGDLPPSLAERVTVDPETGCWKVAGHLDRDGYARYSGAQAHRWVWLAFVGEIPPGRPVLDHVKARGCRYRCCIWPVHLEPVTVRINTMRGDSPSARNARKDTCDRGHPFDLLNTRFNADGSRDCRRCDARRQREYQARLRAAQLADLGRAA